MAETKKEHVPSEEEVTEIFERLINGHTGLDQMKQRLEEIESGPKYKETRLLKDEKGVYLWDVEVEGEKPGETTEYSYQREGNFKEGSANMSTIQATFYENGVPVGGKTVADFVDGKWVLVE